MTPAEREVVGGSQGEVAEYLQGSESKLAYGKENHHASYQARETGKGEGRSRGPTGHVPRPELIQHIQAQHLAGLVPDLGERMQADPSQSSNCGAIPE